MCRGYQNKMSKLGWEMCTRSVSLCLLFFAMLPTALAQNPATSRTPLLSFIESEAVSLSPPTYSGTAQAVSIREAGLRLLGQGSRVLVQVDEAAEVEFTVNTIGNFLNGDRNIRAQGRSDDNNYSLTLTVGSQTLFGYLSSNDGIRQLYAIDRGQFYTGWLYSPRSLLDSNSAFENDYIIPDRRSVSQPEVSQPEVSLPLQPLNLNAPDRESGSTISAASSAEIDPSKLRISQQFSRSNVVLGSSVEILYRFENISSEFHRDLVVDIYFLLENSHANLIPDNCGATTAASGQEILRCDLGNFAQGEEKTFLVSIITTEHSRPNVFSTAIVGDTQFGARSEAYINVVGDITSDSDLDGVSDFNEALVGTNPASSESVADGVVTIDVMALYTPGAASAYGRGVETRINQLVNVANQIYTDSGVGIKLRPVYHGLVNYNDVDDMDTALDHLTHKTDSAFAQVDQLRAAYGADLVMLFRPLAEADTRCGLAHVGGFNTRGDFTNPIEKDFAYSHIAIDCPTDIVVAHELGHNMGLTHSHLEDGSGGTFSYSTGYGVDSQFVTVMAYPGAFNTDIRVPRFSNPSQDCFGFACGVGADQEFGANAASSLNTVKYQIARYFPSQVPDLPLAQVASLRGDETSARIALAASSEDGLSHITRLSPSRSTDIDAEITLDTDHIGQTGLIHVLLVAGADNFLQLTSEGELVPWNGELADLGSVIEARPLTAVERIKVLDSYFPNDALVGQQLTVYVAYQIPESGSFVYTVTPLVLDIVADQRVNQPEFDIGIDE